MAFYIIGIGLSDEKDITLKGLEAIKSCENIYLENYTSKLQIPIEKLESLYGKKIILADRNLVEKGSDAILKDSTAFLVVGDAISATTHIDLIIRAKEKNLDVKIIHNASILNAIGITGLQLYKFGKTSSIVFPEEDWLPETPYDVVKQNNELHTLLLLDIKVKEPSKDDIKKSNDQVMPSKFMTIKEAIKTLLTIENKRKENVFTEETYCIGCARIGSDNVIKYGKAKDLLVQDFGPELHCLIIPGKLHFMEEEMLGLYKI